MCPVRRLARWDKSSGRALSQEASVALLAVVRVPIGVRPPTERDNRCDSGSLFTAICPARSVETAIVMGFAVMQPAPLGGSRSKIGESAEQCYSPGQLSLPLCGCLLGRLQSLTRQFCQRFCMIRADRHDCLSPRELSRREEDECLIILVPIGYENRQSRREIAHGRLANLVSAFSHILKPKSKGDHIIMSCEAAVGHLHERRVENRIQRHVPCQYLIAVLVSDRAFASLGNTRCHYDVAGRSLHLVLGRCSTCCDNQGN